jgi:probable addiction module antidote protein
MTKKSHSPGPEDIARNLSKALERGAPAYMSELMEIVRERGMTNMANKADVCRYTLYRHEWGTARPLLETVLKMTAACGLRLTIVTDDAPRSEVHQTAKNAAR